MSLSWNAWINSRDFNEFLFLKGQILSASISVTRTPLENCKVGRVVALFCSPCHSGSLSRIAFPRLSHESSPCCTRQYAAVWTAEVLRELPEFEAVKPPTTSLYWHACCIPHTCAYIRLHKIKLHSTTVHYMKIDFITLFTCSITFIPTFILICTFKITLHYIALHYTPLHIEIHYISSNCIALDCTTLHSIALHCIKLHSIALHDIPFHSVPVHYITLHYNAFY